jgi:CheY-like chemotaxis protein
MANSKAVIDIVAPNSRTFNMLEFVLQQQGKGRFELGRGSRPDLAVVDFEQGDAGTAFRKYRAKFPGIPVVLLLNKPEEYDALSAADRIGAEYVLLKPFAVKDFVAKIDECLGGARRAEANANASPESETVADSARNPPGKERTLPLRVGNAAKPATRPRSWEPLENEEIAYSFALEPEINMADESAVRGRWLKTGNRLLGHFNNAISQQFLSDAPISLSVPDGLAFHISPFAKTVAVTGDGASLIDLAERELEEGEVLLGRNPMPPESKKNQMELEAFLWKLALYTYRGYLPEGISVNQPVYLKYWPNLTRFEPTPNAMRIASLMCRQPVPLAFVVRILGVPQMHTFNFYAAAHAAGFAGPAVREVDRMLLPSYPDGPAYVAEQADAGGAAISGRKVV